MVRADRIATGWVATWMIAGIILLVANLPVANEPMAAQGELLVRIAMGMIGIGFVAVVVEVVLLLASWRRRPQPPESSPLNAASIPSFSPEIEAMRTELAQRQEVERREQLRLLRDEMTRVRDSYLNPTRGEGSGDPKREMAAWADADNFDRNVRGNLSPADQIEYDRPVDPAMLANPEWHRNVATYYEIKRRRIRGIGPP
jgi:hypothetical protein